MPGVKITEDDRRYSLFKADHFADVNIKWEKQQNLVIEYEKARIFNFCNFWQDAGLDNWNYNVELTLQCTSSDGQLTFRNLTPSTGFQKDTITLLNNIFPIDSIVGITVNNFNGKHSLRLSELNILKAALKDATYAGGLLIKPNHNILEFKLKPRTNIRPGLVYASLGQIHFEGIQIDTSVVSGTFILPSRINFDNYK